MPINISAENSNPTIERPSSLQPTGSLGKSKVMQWRGITAGCALGAFGTAGLTAYLVVAVAFSLTGFGAFGAFVGLFIGGAVLTGLWIKGAIKANEQTKAAVAWSNLSRTIQDGFIKIDNECGSNELWSAENRDRLIRNINEEPQHGEQLCRAVMTICEGKSGRSPQEKRNFYEVTSRISSAEKKANRLAQFEQMVPNVSSEKCFQALTNSYENAALPAFLALMYKTLPVHIVEKCLPSIIDLFFYQSSENHLRQIALAKAFCSVWNHCQYPEECVDCIIDNPYCPQEVAQALCKRVPRCAAFEERTAAEKSENKKQAFKQIQSIRGMTAPQLRDLYPYAKSQSHLVSV